MIETLITQYGEQYRRLIEDGLNWLDAREEQWGLERSVDREAFVENLVRHAKLQSVAERK